MFPSTPIHKESDSHEIYIEINPESVINGKYLARQLTTLAMLLEPDSEEVVIAKIIILTLKLKVITSPKISL